MSVRVPLLDLQAQHATIRDEVYAAISRVVESQHFILGPEVSGLEAEVAAFSRVRRAVGVSSGTDAILLSLMALGVTAGDEVITTPFTFIATCSSIARLGARPVFVDIDPVTYNLDTAGLAAAIGPRTKAIMPVHLFGQMADMSEINRIAQRHGIPVIEDGAQALGAERDGVRAGGAATLGTYSFFPSKNLGGFGDGGMIVTNDEALADRVLLLRNQGQRPKYYSVEVSGNFRLDAIQASVLRAKLPHLERWNDARRRNADTYRELFAASGIAISHGALEANTQLALPIALPESHHVYHHFVIRTRDRDALKEHLSAHHIGCEVYYPQPMHLQTCFAGLGQPRGSFPHAESAALELLAIPVYPELTREMQAAVVDTIAAFFRR